MQLSHRSTVAFVLALLFAAGGLAAQDASPADKPEAQPKPSGKPEESKKEVKAKPKDETKAKPKDETKAKPKDETKAKPKPKGGRGEETRVLTRAEAEARRRSPFLLPPGASPGDQQSGYDADDARDEPPWRRAAFFGVRARGLFFVYVLDQSGSMIDDDRLTRATIELRRSVFALQSPQQFEVIFYNDESTSMPGGPIPRPADQHNKNLLTSWLRLIDPDGETDPRRAIKQALALRPDAVFLLSDGEFPEGTVEAVALANSRKTPIHCIDLAGGLAGDHLERIARDNGGRYVSRPGNLQGQGVPAR